MHWLFKCALIYLVGGLTFIPLVILLALVFLIKRVPADQKAQEQQDALKEEKESLARGEEPGYRLLNAGEFQDTENSGVNAVYSGWIIVTKEFYNFPQVNPKDYQQQNSKNNDNNNNNNNIITSSTGSVNNTTGNNNHITVDSETDSGTTTGTTATVGTNNSSIASIYKQIVNPKSNENEDPASLDARKLRNIKKKHRYWGVLKHGNLFLYNDEEMTNVQHAIVLSNHVVTIWPRNLRDGQLFNRKTAICLLKKGDQNVLYSSKEKKAMSTLDLLLSKKVDNTESPPRNAFFLYGDLNHQKEDWYFALLKATSTNTMNTMSSSDLLEPSFYAYPLYYRTSDMIDLIQTLNSTEGQLTTKWLNAIIGRLFLSLHKTEMLQNFVTNRVQNQLQKIRRPGFLDDFVIKKIDIGHSAPYISDPRLKSISAEGDLETEVNFLYKGGLTVEISTKIFLNLSSRFKPREVTINLKVKVQKIQGNLLLKMKRTPSNRLWYGFTSMPKLDLDIEPVVSSMALNYGMVKTLIGNKFRDAVRDTLVLPFMDDVVFAQSEGDIFRGGIWDKLRRPIQMEDAVALFTEGIPSTIPPAHSRESSIVTSTLNGTNYNEGDADTQFSTSNSLPLHQRQRTVSNSNSFNMTNYQGQDSFMSNASAHDNTKEKRETSIEVPVSEAIFEDADSITSKGSSSGIAKLRSQKSTLSKRASSVLDFVDKKLSQFDDLSDEKTGQSNRTGLDNSSSDSFSSTLNKAKNNKYVTSSVSKLKGWYAKEKQALQEANEAKAAVGGQQKKKPYVAPEMISSRRIRKPSQTSVEIKNATADVLPTESDDIGLFPDVNTGIHSQRLESAIINEEDLVKETQLKSPISISSISPASLPSSPGLPPPLPEREQILQSDSIEVESLKSSEDKIVSSASVPPSLPSRVVSEVSELPWKEHVLSESLDSSSADKQNLLNDPLHDQEDSELRAKLSIKRKAPPALPSRDNTAGF